MRLNLSTQFSLRILLFAAAVKRKTTTREIAQFYGLPLDRVRKAARKLGRLGYLITERGQTGGLRLSKPATEVALGPVIRQLEGSSAASIEARHDGLYRPLQEALHEAMAEAEARFWEKLDRVALAELVAKAELHGGATQASPQGQRAA